MIADRPGLEQTKHAMRRHAIGPARGRKRVKELQRGASMDASADDEGDRDGAA
jgi:hypothetical protein